MVLLKDNLFGLFLFATLPGSSSIFLGLLLVISDFLSRIDLIIQVRVRLLKPLFALFLVKALGRPLAVLGRQSALYKFNTLSANKSKKNKYTYWRSRLPRLGR